ncbi:MAG: aminotransferase class I/II-fold pyridoxal phosphate-dependent enzyme [Clostridia bacterium]|nr:aminotransferase class I/II-fold pyridoxal phosphate-dependent enzyme [Clostridia bacterium]
MSALDQSKTPLFDALMGYVKENTIPFHVPGHKQGRGNGFLTSILGETTMAIDLTCMEDLDNICNPKSVIKEAEKLAAQAYQAENAFFLVNGTTSGIQAMIMSVCRPGDKIILPRNAHKSAISGIILSGAHPIYIEPEIDPFFGIAMGVTPSKVKEALEMHPDAKAVFVINPTYYGIASNLKEICKIAHDFEVPVLVDEAHGAHLVFHEDLPLSAMEAGADLAASSTHKLAGSLTQSSILLHQGNLIDPEYIKSVLNLTQTTSPSYILLASLDIARREMALKGRERLQRTIALTKKAKEQLSKINGIYCLDEDILDGNGKFALDSAKLVINVRNLGFSGYEIERILRKKYHIQIELSDLYNIIVLLTIGDDEITVNAFLKAFKEIVSSRPAKKIVKYTINLPDIPEQQILPRQAFYAETVLLPIEEAEGEISAEMIMAYPPGIPLICPGEKITKEVIQYVKLLHKEDAQLQGTQDPQVKHIKVLKHRLVLLQNQSETYQNAG